MRILQNLKNIQLAKEKIKDFKHVVLVQIVLLLHIFLLDGILQLFGITDTTQIREASFFPFLGVYVFFLWDMLRNYTQNKAFLVFLLVLIMGTFLLAFIVINPFFKLLEQDAFRYVSLLIMGTLLLVEIAVIWFTSIELFTSDLPIQDRLLGAACIYMIIGMAFPGFYEFVCIADINAIIMDVPLGTSHFMKSITFSFLVLSGIDNPFEFSDLIRNITIIEAIFGNLFIVFVVGRIMYK